MKVVHQNCKCDCPKVPEKRLAFGGVFRCCEAELAQTEVLEVPGETITCRYCKGKLRFSDTRNQWEWVNPEEEK